MNSGNILAIREKESRTKKIANLTCFFSKLDMYQTLNTRLKQCLAKFKLVGDSHRLVRITSAAPVQTLNYRVHRSHRMAHGPKSLRHALERNCKTWRWIWPCYQGARQMPQNVCFWILVFRIGSRKRRTHEFGNPEKELSADFSDFRGCCAHAITKPYP